MSVRARIRASLALVRRGIRSVPVLVWLVTGLHVAIMATYTLLYLPYTNPDEPLHHDMAAAWFDGEGVIDPGERQLDPGIDGGFAITLDAYVKRPFTDDSVEPRGDRPSLDELAAGRETAYPYPNQMTQHPPLYYGLLAGVLLVVPGEESWAWDQVVGLLRLTNVVLLAPLPLLAWAAVRPVTRSAAVAVAASTVPLLVPGLSRVGAAINNDNLLTLLGSSLIVLLVRVCLGDVRLKLGVLVGAITGMALLTKGLALAFPPVVLCAYVIGWWRQRGSFPWVATLGAQAVAFAVGGWWWVRNVVRFDALQPVGVGPEALAEIRGPRTPDSVPRDLFEFVDGFFGEISRRIVAWLGLLEPPLFPYWLAALIMGIVGVGVVVCVARRKRSPAPLGVTLVAILPTLGILAIVAYGVYGSYRWNLQFNGSQGRYLYPGIVGISLVTAAGWSAVAARARRWLPLAFVLLAGLAHGMAAKVIVATFWLPPRTDGTRIDDGDVALDTIARWSPWPSFVTAIPMLAVLVLAVSVAVAAIVFAVRGDREPGSGPDTEDRERVVVGAELATDDSIAIQT